MSETREDAEARLDSPHRPLDDTGPPVRPESRPEHGPDRRRPPRMSRIAVMITVGLVLAAGGGTAYALVRDAEEGGSAGGSLLPTTTEVVRGTLTDATTEGGTLGYGTTQDVTARGPGTITWLPSTGEVIGRGDAIFEVDSEPVPLLFGKEPAWRDLYEGLEGRDVRQLEQNLRALGYDGFDVDSEFTYNTELAVLEWQEDLGLDETGVVAMTDIVFNDGPARVDGVLAGLGDVVAPEGATTAVLSVTGTAPAATVELDPSDRRLAEVGTEVEVTLPDGSTMPATIAEVATEVEESEAEPGQEAEATTTLEVVAELDGKEALKKAREYDAAAVDVTFTAGERTDVLIVPVAALVALAEGGFGLEVVEDGTSRYVPVDTGLFSGGQVEVSGDGITEGTVVGVPE